MVNQKLHIGLIALALTSILVLAVALPAANALTPRNFQYFNDNHKTDRFPGGPYVCGDKVCSADEWSKMKQDLRKAQRDPTACTQLKNWMPCGSTSTTKSG
jgi:hypothetical protein